MSEKREAIASHFRSILELLDVDKSLLEKTPFRVADLYMDSLFDGLNPDKKPNIKAHLEPARHNEEVVIDHIAFVSLCEHHLVPMMGTVSISFIPDQYLLGFSRFYDLVRYCAHRPQLQERLTREIADEVIGLLKTEDVCVKVKATHFCILARKEGELTSTVETKAARGAYSPLAVSSFKT